MARPRVRRGRAQDRDPCGQGRGVAPGRTLDDVVRVLHFLGGKGERLAPDDVEPGVRFGEQQQLPFNGVEVVAIRGVGPEPLVNRSARHKDVDAVARRESVERLERLPVQGRHDEGRGGHETQVLGGVAPHGLGGGLWLVG